MSDRATFDEMYGPLVSELTLEQAFEIAETARFTSDGRLLRKVAKAVALNLHHACKSDFPRVLPSLGILRGILSRHHRRVHNWKTLRRKLGRSVMWLGLRFIERAVRKQFPNRPGWNDYYMSLWFVSGSNDVALQIYRRAAHMPGPHASIDEIMTAQTARWMVASVRKKHADFDLVISRLEEMYGPLLTFDFTWRPDRGFRMTPAIPPSGDMTVVEMARTLIIAFERCRLVAYQDSGGVWTIGYGHTHGVTAGMTITAQRAEELLAEDMAPLLKAVATRPLLEAAALVSFGFNCGAAALARVMGGHSMITDFVHDRHGHVVEGLEIRRQLEEKLILVSQQYCSRLVPRP